VSLASQPWGGCDAVPTLSLVSGRSVGIGAYLNRLGRRVVQVVGSPMILTGAAALNKLLGKEVSLPVLMRCILFYTYKSPLAPFGLGKDYRNS
jgi:hypothetical protein